jgi:2-phosphosulfolactate phosphatase
VRRVRVFGSYQGIPTKAVAGLDVVIVDVLRATSTIVFAVSQGARVMSLADEADALAQGQRLGAKAILVGERMGQPLPGFHCNNSVAELSTLALRGRVVVLTTTNGTQAVAAVRAAKRTFAGALTNAPALGRYLCRRGSLVRDVAIVCAGRSTSALATEDLLGAGAVVAAIESSSTRSAPWLADGARMARDLFRRARSVRAAVRDADAATELLERGGAADVDAAAAHGSSDAVPILRGGVFARAR